jgi:hypothetical protein
MALSALPASAQQYKYETPMPPGVASPNSVESRLGTLKFFDGFPDKASAEKLFDNLDFQRAVQAYLMAIPAVSQAATETRSVPSARSTRLSRFGSSWWIPGRLG